MQLMVTRSTKEYPLLGKLVKRTLLFPLPPQIYKLIDDLALRKGKSRKTLCIVFITLEVMTKPCP